MVPAMSISTASNYIVSVVDSAPFKLIVIPTIVPLVAYITYVIQKNREYKYDYYKKVIDNRILAYDLVQRILVELSGVTKDGVDDKLLMTFFHTTRKAEIHQRELDLNDINQMKHGDYYLHYEKDSYGFESFRRLLQIALSKKVWLSYNMISRLEKLATICNEILTNANSKYKEGLFIEPEFTLIQLGKHYYQSIAVTKEQIQHELYKDIEYLSEVPAFLKSKTEYDKSLDGRNLYNHNHSPYNQLFIEIRAKRP